MLPNAAFHQGLHCLLRHRKKYMYIFEIISCNPSIYIMDHPDFIVCILMGNYIVLKRVKIYVIKSALFLFSGFLMWLTVSLTRQLKMYLAASSRISGLLLMRKLLSETVISTVTIQISRQTRLEKKALSGLLTTSSITRSLRELYFLDVGPPGKHRSVQISPNFEHIFEIISLYLQISM